MVGRHIWDVEAASSSLATPTNSAAKAAKRIVNGE